MTKTIEFQDIPGIEDHEISELFPSMSEEEFEALKSDIEQHGQKDPIILYEGKILDGRHRARACFELQISVQARELSEDEPPIEYVISTNLRRRDLTPSQKAVLVTQLDSLREDVEARAQERRLEGAKHGGATAGRGRQKSVESSEENGDSPREKIPRANRARDELAQIAAVNSRYISDAITLEETDPDLADRVLAGELSLPAAIKRIRQEEYQDKLRKHGLDEEIVTRIISGRIRLSDYDTRRLAELTKEQQHALLGTIPKGSACNVDLTINLLGLKDSWDDDDEADVLFKRRLEAARAGQEALQQVKESLDVLGISTFSELLEMLASTFYDVLAAKPEATAVEATAGVE